jgi:hypothetical protein
MVGWSGERFIVTAFEGFPIRERPDGRGGRAVVSYYVQDTAHAYHVVRTFENIGGKSRVNRSVLRARAERFCKRLNDWNEAEVHDVILV